MRYAMGLASALAVAGCQDPVPRLVDPATQEDQIAFFHDLDHELKTWERLEAEGKKVESLHQERRIGWITVRSRRHLVSALVAESDMPGYNASHQAIAAAAVGFSYDETLTGPLERCLENSDPRVVANALASYAHLRYPYLDPRRIVRFFQWEDAAVRAGAAFYLGRSLSAAGDEEALTALMLAVSDPAAEVRANAIEALAEIGDPASSRALAGALASEPVPQIRARAARALGRVGGDDAIGALVGALDSERDENVRAQIFAALQEATGAPFGRDVDRWWSWWTEHLASIGQAGRIPSRIRPIAPPVEPPPDFPDPREIPPVGPGPEPRIDPEPPVGPPPGPGPIELPIEPPSGSGEPADFTQIFYDLEHGTPVEKAAARFELVRRGAAALPHIYNRLWKGEEVFALQLLRAIEEIGDAGSLDALRRVFERENMNIRISVIQVAFEISGAGALDLFESALSDPWAKVRRVAADRALRSGSSAGIAVFIDALASDEVTVRSHAISTLRDWTAQDFAFVPEAEPESREASIARWRAWWAANKDTFQPPR